MLESCQQRLCNNVLLVNEQCRRADMKASVLCMLTTWLLKSRL